MCHVTVCFALVLVLEEAAVDASLRCPCLRAEAPVSILGLLDMLTAAPPRERKRGRERSSLDPLRPASAPVAVGGSTASCTSRGRANRGRATAKEGEAAAEVQAMSLIKEEGRSFACRRERRWRWWGKMGNGHTRVGGRRCRGGEERGGDGSGGGSAVEEGGVGFAGGSGGRCGSRARKRGALGCVVGRWGGWIGLWWDQPRVEEKNMEISHFK